MASFSRSCPPAFPGRVPGVRVGQPEPVAHHVLDAVLEDDEPFLERVVGQGHVVGHHYLERQPEHHVFAVVPGVPERHLKVPGAGYRASIHFNVSRMLISWLSARYWSVSAARVVMTRCRSAMTWKSSIPLAS